LNDVFSIVRFAYLDKQSNNRIVMSALRSSVLGKTDSGRPISIINLPPALNSKEVVDLLWKPVFMHKEICMRNLQSFYLLAAATSQVPRVVEVIERSLKTVFAMQQRLNLHVDDFDIFFQSMLSNAFDLLNNLYSGVKFLENKYLYPLVFRKPIAIDDKVSQLILESSYTNSLQADEISTDRMKTLIPEASPFFLYLSATKASDGVSATLLQQIKNILSASYSGTENYGSLLE
jgi:hypothetical protein